MFVCFFFFFLFFCFFFCFFCFVLFFFFVFFLLFFFFLFFVFCFFVCFFFFFFFFFFLLFRIDPFLKGLHGVKSGMLSPISKWRQIIHECPFTIRLKPLDLALPALSIFNQKRRVKFVLVLTFVACLGISRRYLIFHLNRHLREQFT